MVLRPLQGTCKYAVCSPFSFLRFFYFFSLFTPWLYLVVWFFISLFCRPFFCFFDSLSSSFNFFLFFSLWSLLTHCFLASFLSCSWFISPLFFFFLIISWSWVFTRSYASLGTAIVTPGAAVVPCLCRVNLLEDLLVNSDYAFLFFL